MLLPTSISVALPVLLCAAAPPPWSATFTPAAVRAMIHGADADAAAEGIAVAPVGPAARDAAGALVVTLRGLPEVRAAALCDLMDPVMRRLDDLRLVYRCGGPGVDQVIVVRSAVDVEAEGAPAASPAVSVGVFLAAGQTVGWHDAVAGEAPVSRSVGGARVAEYHRQRIWYWDGESRPPPGLEAPARDGFVHGDRGRLLEGRELYAIAGTHEDMEAWSERARVKTGLWVAGASGLGVGTLGVLGGQSPAMPLQQDERIGLTVAGSILLAGGLASFLVGVLLPDDPFDLDERRERVRDYNQELRERLGQSDEAEAEP